MVDYPDFYEHVERSPTQPTSDQVYGIVASGQRNVAASTKDYYTYNLPNDGRQYIIDTIFLYWTAKGTIFSFVNYSATQVAPVWIGLAAKAADYSTDYVLSRQGAFNLTYPNALRIEWDNDNAVSRSWWAYIKLYSYIIQ
jgi:hypothetical protein